MHPVRPMGASSASSVSNAFNAYIQCIHCTECMHSMQPMRPTHVSKASNASNAPNAFNAFNASNALDAPNSDFLARRQALTVMSARGATCARSQVRRNCASPCAARRAPKVQRVTAVCLLERVSARQTLQLCGAAAIAPRAPARAQNRRCTRAAGATP